MYKSFVILLGLSLFLLPCHSYSQINRNGIHIMEHYIPDHYHASPQNWAIVQDSREMIYVGNEGKVLEYDGQDWRSIPNDNGSYVRSLSVDPEGTVYVGSVGEFGYLKPNKTGKLEFVNLSTHIDSSFRDVWKTYTHGDTIFFCTKKYIFQYENHALRKQIKLDEWHFLDFLVNGRLYLGNYKKGLMLLKGNKPVIAPGGSFYSEKDIFVVLPFHSNELLIGVQKKGFYLYNPQTGLSRSVSTLGRHFDELNRYFQQIHLYNGIKLQNGHYAFATLDDGLIIVNGQTGEIEFHYDDNTGLPDPTVLYPYESMQGNIWLGLNNGITKIEYHSPFTHFIKESGYRTYPLDVIKFKGNLFVATTNGVFLLQINEEGIPVFSNILNINNLASFLKMDFEGTATDRLLVGTHEGIYDITDVHQIVQLDERFDNVFKVNTMIQSSYHPERIYVGYTSGVIEFEYTNRGWVKTGQDQNITASIRFLAEENDSVLWVSSELNRIINMEKMRKTAVYDTSDGLPSMTSNRVFRMNGKIYFSTSKGFYQYNKEQEHFKPASVFGGRYAGKHIRFVKPYKDNSYWIVYSDKDEQEHIEKVIPQNNGYQFVDTPFKRLSGATYYNSYNGEDDLTWFATGDGIYVYDNDYRKNYRSRYQALIRQITMSGDSTIFNGTYYTDTNEYKLSGEQPKNLQYALDFRNNDIEFRFSSPWFEQESAIRYSYRLEGYENAWSDWTVSNFRGYTNLDAGEYTFRVKARNIYGSQSEEAAFAFRVKPPWYQTAWAYSVYLIAGIGLIALIVRLYTRRLAREKVRLEEIVQERTRKVVQQKEKIEQQRDEIAKKNRDITDSIEYASKIQSAVLPAEDITRNILPEHFIIFRPQHIVSGDFYWINKKNGLLFVIAADCTGHGVPGAFMSMLGVSLLNEIVNKHAVTQANYVLNELRNEVKRTLKQTGKEGEAKDGMDIAMTMIDLGNMKMQFAGAYNPLYLFRDGKFQEYKGDRMPIGIFLKENPSFTNHDIDLKKGDTFYIFSDGYQDQFGGKDGTKFKVKRFKKLLTEIHHKPMEEQREIIERTYDEWKGNHPQLDDVVIVGLKI
jgi:serine phosphatase RsbU (regulator of sigma subunit)